METKPLNSPTAAYPYKSPTPDEIAIVALGIVNGLHPSVTVPKQTFVQLKECNFNAAHLYGGHTSIEQKDATATSLGYAANSNISIIVGCYYFDLPSGNDQTGMKDAKDFFEFFSIPKTYVNKDGIIKKNNSNAIKGWYLKDEPTYSQLEKPSDSSSFCLINLYNLLKTDGQKRPIQVNLVGTKGEKTEYNPYQDYLDLFQNNFKPNLWSYDLYPVTQKSCLINNKCNVDDNCKLSVLYQTFYEDLNIFQERATATHGVFWAYVQSMEFISGDTLYPAALEPYIRFEAFTALAFGAQGIAYWNYMQQHNETSEVNTSALVDKYGTRMPAWYFAREVNYEIKQYSKVFVNSKLIKWAQVGQNYGGPVLGKNGIGAIQSIMGVGGRALVTQLRTNGHNYMIIVSHKIESYQFLKITFKPDLVIYELTPTNSHGEHCKEKQINTQTIQRQLIPGGYLIYEFIGEVS